MRTRSSLHAIAALSPHASHPHTHSGVEEEGGSTGGCSEGEGERDTAAAADGLRVDQRPTAPETTGRPDRGAMQATGRSIYI